MPEGTVRRWKSTHKWDNERSDKKSERSERKKGGQPGNRNAEGHGGTGPPGNKNAVRTGEFETLFFNTLNWEEQQLTSMIGLDKEQLLLQEIQLLTVREYRMLHRIEALKNAETQQNEEEKPPPGMTVVKYTDGLEKGDCTELKEYAGILGQIQQIEDALTRVQAKKQKAIEAIHKFGYDDALDAFGCHGIGGILGGVLTGLFCVPELSWTGKGGLFYTGDVSLLISQVLGIVVTVAIVLVLDLVIAAVVKALFHGSLRVDEADEALGLDASQHGESAYPSFSGLD